MVRNLNKFKGGDTSTRRKVFAISLVFLDGNICLCVPLGCRLKATTTEFGAREEQGVHLHAIYMQPWSLVYCLPQNLTFKSPIFFSPHLFHRFLR